MMAIPRGGTGAFHQTYCTTAAFMASSPLGDNSGRGMARAALIFFLLITVCAPRAASVSTPPTSSYDDQEARRLIQVQMNCFTREAQSKILDKFDLETAALGANVRAISFSPRTRAE